MSAVFLTGATGFLGYAVALELAGAGYEVRALTRSGKLPGELVDRGVRAVEGDLLDEGALARGMEGAWGALHVAADVNMWSRRWVQSHAANVEGTRAVVDVALRRGVTRLVLTSSASTLGKRLAEQRAERVVTVDETAAYDLAPLGMTYPHTKWLSEQVCLAARERGLEVVITHPTMILGPWDWKGNLLPLFRAARGWGLVAVPGGWRTPCDVRDVAAAHRAALERGEDGARYALGGESRPAREVLALICEAVGGRPPRFTLPDGAVRALSRGMEAWAALTDRAPLLSREMAEQSLFRVRVKSARAERELGYRSRPARESVADQVAWYRSVGWL